MTDRLVPQAASQHRSGAGLACARSLALAGLLASGMAFADSHSVEGVGRISVAPGYRWVPNGYFAEKAAAAGAPFTRPSLGGPAITGSFGYGAAESIEATIDLFAAWETFELAGYQPFNSYSYGALLGIRLTRVDLPFQGWVPYLGAQVGPTLATVSSPSLPGAEHLLGGISVNGGVTWRFSGQWGVSVDVRWLLARAWVTDLAGINMGGFFFSLGLTNFVASTAPKQEFSAPGF